MALHRFSPAAPVIRVRPCPSVVKNSNATCPNRPSQNEYRKRVFKCGMRPSSLPSSLRYDAASCFDAARSAGWLNNKATKEQSFAVLVAWFLGCSKKFPSASIRFPSSPSIVRHVPKRQRTGALQDASRLLGRSESPPGLGLRWPSTAFPPIVHPKMNTGKECSRAECARLRSRLHCVTTRRVASTRQGVRSAPQFDFRHRPASCAAFQSARGLAHSKTLRARRAGSKFPPGLGLRRPSAASPAVARNSCSSMPIRG